MCKDTNEVPEQSKAVLPTSEQRVRPKSSTTSNVVTRVPSASKSSAVAACRPKSSKGARAEKKPPESQALRKKKSSLNGLKDRQVSTIDDEADEESNSLVEDEELDDEGSTC